MKLPVDHAPDPNLHRVGSIAVELAERIRDEDPRRLFDELVALCQWHPAKAAQILMAFAAWFDTEVGVETLWARVAAITAGRAA